MKTISKLHYISQGETPAHHLENIQKACSSGVDWVQLRLKDLSEKKILQTAEKAREITAHYQTKLIINDHYKIAKKIQADGVHLGKTDACPKLVRKALPSWAIIGGTANTLADCHALLDKHIDYIGLGPFRFTSTKKNLSPVLALQGYRDILENLASPTPIIAIGGITLADVPAILQTGIQGIALSGSLTADFNQTKAFNQLLQGPSTQEQRHVFPL